MLPVILWSRLVYILIVLTWLILWVRLLIVITTLSSIIRLLKLLLIYLVCILRVLPVIARRIWRPVILFGPLLVARSTLLVVRHPLVEPSLVTLALVLTGRGERLRSRPLLLLHHLIVLVMFPF